MIEKEQDLLAINYANTITRLIKRISGAFFFYVVQPAFTFVSQALFIHFSHLSYLLHL